MENLCLYCLEKHDGDTVCPFCGKTDDCANNPSNALPAGYILEGRYLIGRVIGSGGFGTTYLARDLELDRKCAIKEYFPVNCAGRNSAVSCTVMPGYGENQENFDEGRRRFIDEARVLAKVDGNPGIVNIKHSFSANGTSYMVMELLEGDNLQSVLKDGGKFSFDRLYAMLRPAMEGLAAVHDLGLLHRDISPSNLIMLKNGSIKLIDFGAARGMNPNGEKSVSVILKPGYAPIEQFSSHGAQTAATDIYALCATMYALITGAAPQDTIMRYHNDSTALPSQLGAEISAEQEAVLMRGFSVEASDRQQSVRQLMDEFDAAAKVSVPQTKPGPVVIPGPAGGDEKCGTEKRRPEKRSGKRVKKGGMSDRKGRLLIGGAVVLLALLAVAVAGVFSSGSSSSSESFSDSIVTKKDIVRLSRQKGTVYLYFYNCEIDDDAVAALPKCRGIKNVSFSNCSGFSSLNPLKDMPSLETLTIDFSSGSEYSESSGSFENIRQAADLSALFSDSLGNIDVLNLRNAAFTGDFTGGLACFTNLRYLQISDSSGFSCDDIPRELPLKSVTLTNDGLDSAEGLSVFKNITTLDLSCNNLSDLSGLEGMPLDFLTVSENRLRDISALDGCSTLYSVTLDNNLIEDISPLSACTKVSTVILGNNRISDLSPLEGHTEIKTLSLCCNDISDITPISCCTELTRLDLHSNRLSNLDALEEMIHLKWLSASDNEITDISGLVNTTQLQAIYLKGNSISDISPLAGNAAVTEYLFLGANSIEDISPLEGFAAIKSLSVFENSIADISALSCMTKIQYFSAYGNRIEDIYALGGCTELYVTDLADNMISDISPLSATKAEKRVLLLQNNRISDISSLAPLTNYVYLFLHGNDISDFSIVREFANIDRYLSQLYLSYVEGADFSPLYEGNYGTEQIMLTDTPLNVRVPIDEAAMAYNNTVEGRFGYSPFAYITSADADADADELRDEFGERYDGN